MPFNYHFPQFSRENLTVSQPLNPVKCCCILCLYTLYFLKWCRMLTGWWPCTDNHRCCDFVSAAVLCIQKTRLHWFFCFLFPGSLSLVAVGCDGTMSRIFQWYYFLLLIDLLGIKLQQVFYVYFVSWKFIKVVYSHICCRAFIDFYLLSGNRFVFPSPHTQICLSFLIPNYSY